LSQEDYEWYRKQSYHELEPGIEKFGKENGWSDEKINASIENTLDGPPSPYQDQIIGFSFHLNDYKKNPQFWDTMVIHYTKRGLESGVSYKLTDFRDYVFPELRRRGIIEATTLEELGFDRTQQTSGMKMTYCHICKKWAYRSVILLGDLPNQQFCCRKCNDKLFNEGKTTTRMITE